MIEYVELLVSLKILGKDQPVTAKVKLLPGYPMYEEAGELSIVENEMGLSTGSADAQCFKLCLLQLFHPDAYESLHDEILERLEDLEMITRQL